MALARAAKKMQPHSVTAAVDIGASKVSCLIANVLALPGGIQELEIIGVGSQGIQMREARHDLSASREQAIRGAVDSAERMAGQTIRKAHIAISGRQLIARRLGVDMVLDGAAVVREDIMQCLAKGAAMASQGSGVALHALPIRFLLDGEDVGGNPVGMIGEEMATQVLGLATRENHDANLRALLERCDLEVDRIFAAPVAAGEAVLIEDEKELGAIMLDIGARTTDFAIYDNGAMIACGGVPVGGEHVTRDIAQIFGGSLSFSERLKVLEGSTLTSSGDDHRYIDVPQLNDSQDKVRISRAELSAVISSRLEEIFALVAEQAINAGGKGRAGLRRAVLTGGGALMTGARETAESVLGVKARLGNPPGLVGLPEVASSPQYAVCAGALIHAIGQYQAWSDQSDSNLYAYDFVHSQREGVLRELAQWLRMNF